MIKKFALALVIAPALLASAHAQTPTRDQLWALCINADHAHSAAEAIDACTQIVGSVREAEVNVGIAHFNRANARMSAGDNVGAADD